MLGVNGQPQAFMVGPLAPFFCGRGHRQNVNPAAGDCMLKKLARYFTVGEWLLWLGSLALIVLSFALFDRANYLTLAASLVGATSLIFSAKGNPLGQVLMLAFSVLYGIISYTFAYYGEMLTYLGMTAPMALFALIAWLRHPYKGQRAQVAVGKLKRGEWIWMLLAAAAITAAFWFILDAFNTANLVPSTISVTTSFLAVYLTFRRSPYFALAYAANDVVLIVLWVLATLEDISYISVVVCFVLFFFNDLYGFWNWNRMRRAQAAPAPAADAAPPATAEPAARDEAGSAR